VVFHLLSRFVSFTAYGDELVVLLTDAFFDAFGAVVFVFLLGADVTLHTALSACESGCCVIEQLRCGCFAIADRSLRLYFNSENS
jgi:hypothetical protein